VSGFLLGLFGVNEMAKKKSAAIPELSRDEFPGKVRMEVRFDADVHKSLKKLADDGGVSINQLLNGLARWAGQKLRVGEPVKSDDGIVIGSEHVQGCYWFGEQAYRVTFEELRRKLCEGEDDHYCSHIHSMSSDELFENHRGWKGCYENKGYVAVRLDFTERRVVRED
jgi:hypothetical protein